jgi:hypothetical protein
MNLSTFTQEYNLLVTLELLDRSIDTNKWVWCAADFDESYKCLSVFLFKDEPDFSRHFTEWISYSAVKFLIDIDIEKYLDDFVSDNIKFFREFSLNSLKRTDDIKAD